MEKNWPRGVRGGRELFLGQRRRALRVRIRIPRRRGGPGQASGNRAEIRSGPRTGHAVTKVRDCAATLSLGRGCEESDRPPDHEGTRRSPLLSNQGTAPELHRIHRETISPNRIAQRRFVHGFLSRTGDRLPIRFAEREPRKIRGELSRPVRENGPDRRSFPGVFSQAHSGAGISARPDLVLSR